MTTAERLALVDSLTIERRGNHSAPWHVLTPEGERVSLIRPNPDGSPATFQSTFGSPHDGMPDYRSAFRTKRDAQAAVELLRRRVLAAAEEPVA